MAGQREEYERLVAQYGKDSWKAESFRWRGRILEGEAAHWCADWDYLPIDEICPEWPCACAAELIEQAGDENRA